MKFLPLLFLVLGNLMRTSTAFPERFTGARGQGASGISLLGCLLGVVLLAGPLVKALPEGFEDQDVASVTKVTDISIGTHRDGTTVMYAITKPGFVHVLTNFELEDSDPTNEEVLDLSDVLCDDRERGLGGVELHPNFQQNGYIYLYYTYKGEEDSCDYHKRKGPRNRCSRFTVRDDYSVDINTEKIIFETKPTIESIHNSGDMSFGVDGMLYVTVGDDGQRKDPFSQDRSHLFGKMLRITEDGEIPSDNPYTGEGTAPCREKGRIPTGLPRDTICQEIFAYGLRNPFRFVMDPHSPDKVVFYINDVGAKMWEETNRGGADYAGANYGWPVLEGPCEWDSDDECPVYEEFVDPFFWYKHNSAQEGAAVGIVVVPPGTNWPQEYHRALFVVEYIEGKVYHLTEDQDNYCRTCTPPRPGYKKDTFHRHDRPVGFKFGPYGNNLQAMYYTARSGSINIRRIVYKGSANSAPIADFTMSAAIVEVGGTVEFDASGSYDPDDHDSLTYEWDFGDGSAVASGKVVEHKFQAAGTYEIELTIRDAGGFTDSHRDTATVGNPPVVEIVSPSAGTRFAVGDRFTVVGKGTDFEGNALDGSALEWEVRQHHGSHFHPFFSAVGETVVLPKAPSPEDFLAATNSYLEVLLTGTDSLGLLTTVSQFIIPKTVWLDFDTIPSNLHIRLDSKKVPTPARVLSWENHKLHIVAPDQDGYLFVNWSNEMNQTQKYTVPSGISGTQQVPRYVATFRQDVPTQSPTTLEPTASPTASPTARPTARPTSSPTAGPTGSPTPSPTADPTKFIPRTDSDDTASVGIGASSDGELPDDSFRFSASWVPTWSVLVCVVAVVLATRNF